MLETDLQSAVVKSVITAGGSAHKLSNRFITGVADLLIKIPEFEAFCLEVKFGRYTPPLRVKDVSVPLKTPQWRFLRNYWRAGMPTGVLSFAGHNCQSMWVTVLWANDFRRFRTADTEPDWLFKIPAERYVKLDPRTPEFVALLKQSLTALNQTTGGLHNVRDGAD
jgi:hypothetical protein